MGKRTKLQYDLVSKKILVPEKKTKIISNPR